jgi:flagellar hook-associated protein 1 FlgK
MSLDLALGIARSGLAAVQRGLAQNAQNVANADTPGYTRKAVPQSSLAVGDQPMGLRTAEARRDVDAALVARLDASRAAAAGAAAREDILSGVEAAHGTAEGGGLADALAELRSGFIALRGAPADAGKQMAALEGARGVAEGLNRLSDAIGAARQRAQDGIVEEVAAANATLREIAGLTLRIKTGGDGAAASLEDQRDLAVSRLSESLEVRAVRQPGGDLLLVARGGVVLPLDPDRDVLSTSGATVTPGGSFASGTLPGVSLNGLDITGQLGGGGRLGEYVALRDSTLPRFQAEADVLAATLAGRLDAQGLRLFTDAGGTVPAPALPYAGGAQLGFAGRIRLNPGVEANPALLRDGTHAVAGSAGGPTAFAEPGGRRALARHPHQRAGPERNPRLALRGAGGAGGLRRPRGRGADRRPRRRHGSPRAGGRAAERAGGQVWPTLRRGSRRRDGGDGRAPERLRGERAGARHGAGHVGLAAGGGAVGRDRAAAAARPPHTRHPYAEATPPSRR